jgi:hypothetical protein
MSGIAPAVSFLRGLTGIERHADGAIRRRLLTGSQKS